MIDLQEFCAKSNIDDKKSKIDAVILLLYYAIAFEGSDGLSPNEINSLFEKAHLPLYNRTYLKRDLSKDKRTTPIPKTNKYKLTLGELKKLNMEYGYLLEKEIQINVRVDLNKTPLFDQSALEGAKKMSQLYIILYCWENSVRKVIEQTLTKKIGLDWWDDTKNKELENKYLDRKNKEEKQKWISPRGTQSPLYYLDWGDLIKIIRKNEHHFISQIPDIKFIELRLEELERLRNIIAHNGLVPDENDIDRIVVHFNDWCSQIK
ncbi:hypothetical protein FIC_00228 [Flavobacteriaceae bacterium 3519-10]|nr:hypothetical protein FIC_00228 [Flavobacteriaceae bacterium 3519-10]